MNSRLEISKVDRHEADWDPATLFSGYTIRAVLADTNDVITKISKKSRLAKRLAREVGDQDEDWILQDHPRNNEVELYLKSSAPLIMWKLQDHEAFSGLFDRVEQHVSNPDAFRDKDDQVSS